MKGRNLFFFYRYMGRFARISAVLLLLVLPSLATAGEGKPPRAALDSLPFRPGEQLTYNISWSNVISAGTATLEVQHDRTADGRDAFRFVSTARSSGIVDTFYRVDDRIQSLVVARGMLPLVYEMKQRHGKRKKERELIFDHDGGTVTYRRDGFQEVVQVPEGVQDALSSMYYLRSQESFTVNGTIVIPVHDAGKTWSVEIQVLGRERITVPAGTFETIKVKTYPKYEGVFMHKGEIFIWMTDDARRVPVLMKSTIAIGSIMATLTGMRFGGEAK